MGEVKFRAWDSALRIYHYWSAIQNSYDGIFWSMVKRKEFKHGVEQFTGLVDRNGNDIYESDIVTMFGLPDCFQIFFRYGAFGYEPQIKVKGTYPLIPFCDHSAQKEIARTIEVTGNIHDDPDLLEK